MAKADKHKGPSTQKLKNLLNKEETQMADVNELRRRRNESDSSASTETVKEMDSLLDAATAQESATEASTGTTNLFDQSAADAAKTTTTADAAEKAAREAKIQAKNDRLRAAKASVISGTNKELTPAQAQYQAACFANFTLEALIFENSAKANLSMSRKAQKDANGYIFLPGVKEADKNAINAKGSRAGVNLFDNVQASSSITYSMGGPTKLRGGIVSIPAPLNVTPLQLKSEDFTPPTQSEIQSADRINVVANTDQLFYYIACCCGGTINENSAVAETAAYKHSQSPVLAEYKVGFKKAANGAASGESILRPYFHVNRRKLAIRENVIPTKIFTTVPLAAMSQTDKNTLEEFISAKFEKTGTGSNSAYATLQEKHKGLVNQEGDKYKLTFLNNPEALATAELKAVDWGSSTYTNNKEVKTVLTDYPMPVYTVSISEKTGKPTYKYSNRVLGSEGVTLQDIAVDYPAARRAMELGISEDEIMKMVQESKSAESAARKSKRAPGKIKAESSIIPAADLVAPFLAKLTSGQDLGNGMNAQSLNRALNAISYRH